MAYGGPDAGPQGLAFPLMRAGTEHVGSLDDGPVTRQVRRRRKLDSPRTPRALQGVFGGVDDHTAVPLLHPEDVSLRVSADAVAMVKFDGIVELLPHPQQRAELVRGNL